MKHGDIRMGWILAMFDLPVISREERRIATLFRKALLNEGYVMIQFSVYARPCINRDQMDKHVNKVKAFIPEGGNVKLLFLTNQQWIRGYNIAGNQKPSRKERHPELDFDGPETDFHAELPKNLANMPDQIEFW